MKASAHAPLFIALCAMNTMAVGQNILENAAQDSCIPPHQFVELTAATAGTQTDAYGQTTVALGAYERVSPDGRFVLRSYSAPRLGEVSLIELSAAGQVVQAIETPFKNEAFPVQGTWRYLVDTNGDHYTFNSILRNEFAGSSPVLSKKPKPTPVFKGGMNGFYAAASELPSSKPGHIRIRSLSWPNASDSDRPGEGALASRTLEIQTAAQRITADSGVVFHCRERVRTDGPLYALPMISVDGQEFAALPQMPVQGKQTMRVFGFGADGKQCEERANFDFSSGKTIFGYSNEVQKANLAWEYQSDAWWYSRELGMPFNIAPYDLEGRVIATGYELQASAFPGITRDGRVIYGATLKDCSANNSKLCKQRAGYIITDPYQSNAYQQFLLTYKGIARRQCITHGDVQRERAAFAKFHDLKTD